MISVKRLISLQILFNTIVREKNNAFENSEGNNESNLIRERNILIKHNTIESCSTNDINSRIKKLLHRI